MLRAGDHGENPVIEFEPVSGNNPALKRMLEAAGLPTDDLLDAGRAFFAATRGGVARGFGGFETAGTDVLLRSIVVDPHVRGQGVGHVITRGVLDQARAGGAARAFLLTTSAAPFFERIGFTVIDRAAAPDAILQTRQAASICPVSAILMMMDLAS
ncbi:arsenic resistance N-acetyltransferase ArsN2 [Pararhizobium sp. O133]|uniref:arsenic resistance N-acetyltransferase ArsN2 n=1 Tax=Pararhizobium sp. O133 TaxID=3449278 RepID=UPI003F6840DD